MKFDIFYLSLENQKSSNEKLKAKRKMLCGRKTKKIYEVLLATHQSFNCQMKQRTQLFFTPPSKVKQTKNKISHRAISFQKEDWSLTISRQALYRFTEEAAAACSAHLDELARKSLPVSFSKPDPFFMLDERAKNDHEGDVFICELGTQVWCVLATDRQLNDLEIFCTNLRPSPCGRTIRPYALQVWLHTDIRK